MAYLDALREYGLSDNEIAVFVACLKLGESTAQSISKEAKLPRTTCYHLLEALGQKGLVNYVVKESKKNFQAVKPNVLNQILDDKKRIIDDILPELNAISGTITSKPSVSISEGTKGIKNILLDVLEEKEEILHYGEIKSLQNVLPYIFPQYINERVRRKIPIRVLGKKEKEHLELIKNSKKEFRKFKFLPENYEFKTSVFIYKNKVAILNLTKEPYYGTIVENEDFYDTQKNFFELLWKLIK